jgi:hypothetical protein
MKHLDNGANLVFVAVIMAVMLFLYITLMFHLAPPNYTS